MNAAIINVGNELLNGQTTNSNLVYLCRELKRLGIVCDEAHSVKDDEQAIVRVFHSLKQPIVIFTGGLGPTKDDLTKETVAKMLDLELIYDEKTHIQIENYFTKMKQSVASTNHKQALFPKGSVILPNEIGTAPGAIITHGNQTIVLLPGPPLELKHMFENEAIKHLSHLIDGEHYEGGYLVVGIGEAAMEEKLSTFYRQHEAVQIAPYASTGEIRYVFISEDKEALDRALKAFRQQYSEYIVGSYETTLEKEIVDFLLSRRQTISVVESCTGGMVASRLVNIAGVSEVFKEAYVLYDNQAKIRQLGVSPTVIDTYGAVSEQCAYEMSYRLIEKTGADIALSITGIAGPSGGTKDKPVGTVYFGITHHSTTKTYHRVFTGNRPMIRQKATHYGLYMILRSLRHENND